ncbi:hypothetical protein RJ639_044672, partial [Escallonia herrerae]
ERTKTRKPADLKVMEWSLGILIWLLIVLLHISRRWISGSNQLPPGPPGWPVVGHMFSLGEMPHRTLAGLKEKYGPVVWLKLGSHDTMVVLTAAAATELFKHHDVSFAGRTIRETMRSHDYHKGSLALSQYGKHWRVLRRICTLEMLVNRRLNETVSIREKCVNDMLSRIEKESHAAKGKGEIHVTRIVFFTMFNMLGNSMVSRDMVDPDSKEGSDFYNALIALKEWSGRPNVSDLFPCLRWLDLQGLRKKMDRDMGELLRIGFGLVKERLEERQDGGEKRKDFLDVLLDFEGSGKDETAKISEKDIAIFILELFQAGGETTSTSIEWAMTELLRNPEAMAVTKAELAKVIGPNRNFQESDIDSLPYLQAVVKETLRLHPPIPFLVPRKAIQDANFMGYHIPKNTQVFVNAWAIGRDPEYWDDPSAFKPERFLGSKIDYKGQNFEFIPFGAGRRICAGIPLAHRMLHSILGSLLYAFDWELGGDVTCETMDMRDKMGQKLDMAVAPPSTHHSHLDPSDLRLRLTSRSSYSRKYRSTADLTYDPREKSRDHVTRSGSCYRHDPSVEGSTNSSPEQVARDETPRRPSEILHKIKDNKALKWPEKMTSRPNERNRDLWCHFHNDHGHTTDDCGSLKRAIEVLIKRGQLRKWVARKEGRQETPSAAEEREREENAGTINTISRGLAAGGSSGQAQKAYTREVCIMSQPPSKKPKAVPLPTISFSEDDLKNVKTPHDDPLVITIKAGNFDVRRVLVDNGSSAEVLFYDAFKKMNIPMDHLRKMDTPLYGFSNHPVTIEAAAAAEFFKNHDLSFMDRMIKETMRSHDYDKNSLALAPYGTHWRFLRRMCTVEMFVNKRINETVALRKKLVNDMVLRIEKESHLMDEGHGVHVNRFVFFCLFNMLGNLILSRDLVDPDSEEGSDFYTTMVSLKEWSGRFNISDLFPSLKWLDLQGLRKKMDRDYGKLLGITSTFVKERLEERENGRERRKDFLDNLLDFEGNGKDEPAKLSEKCIGTFILELFSAGSETTSTTVEWAMTELLCNPDTVFNVKAELAKVVGPTKKFEESDINDLQYLQAVVKETLRLHPPVPFLIPRKAIHDTSFMGYDIPKGTQVLVNAWAIGRDPKRWDDPLSFKPGRFLDSQVDYKGKDFEVIPFGAGRRICAGISLAHRMLHYILGSLLHEFDWELESHVTRETMDMTDRIGVSVRKFEPLKAVPRRSTQVWSS